MFQECGFWASGNDPVQMLFLMPNRNMFAGKFVKSKRVLAVLREQFVVNVKLVEIREMSEVFWEKLYCKMSDFFRWFLLALRLSLRKSEIKNISDNAHWNKRTNIKNLYAWINIFKKKNSKCEILNHFGPNLGTALGRFSQCFFLIFHRRSVMVSDIFTQSPTIKKLPTALQSHFTCKKIWQLMHLIFQF